MARGVLAGLGDPGAALLQADRANIWAPPGSLLEIDAEYHEEGLRAALDMSPCGSGCTSGLLSPCT